MDLKQEAEEKYIDSNEVKLHTLIFGSGKPVILLHGFPDYWYGWKDIILGLKEEFKLIVPDLRGYNLSDKPENQESYKIQYLIEDVRSICQTLQLEKVTLIGHDWGGMIAWIFAEQHPELLNKLIILNAPHPKIFGKKIRENTEQRKASSYIFQFLKPDGHEYLYEERFKPLRRSVFSTAVKKFSKEDKKKYIRAWSQSGAILGGVNYYRANQDFSEFTGIIKVPTLVIFGMKDMFVMPVVLEGLEEYVEDLEIFKVENGSHWVMHDEPKLVNSKIKSFITT